jgi:D-serine dehydratase
VIQSIPEPGLAILNVGKRDVSFDIHLPRAEKWFRRDLHRLPQPMPVMTTTTQINDQHLFLEVPDHSPLRIGDMIGLGISHPCTTFDKWRLLYVINDDYDVTEGILTFF